MSSTATVGLTKTGESKGEGKKKVSKGSDKYLQKNRKS